ncbi:MAG TPA: ABC transporter permease subunit [Actinophytocola sp.]|uniref:ABC transporter permease n=1 Tax=Actinophytocola sp. TaxID=1872138 RepID=UPI002DBA4157|nr:ABC transporter permease subunit [Actinophytocola sp.]HEU5471020.1 ABC transporter permease subunit [Actinophytocola sp.]
MNLTIATLTARALFGRRRVLLLLPMPAVLITLTLIANGSPEPVAEWGPIVFGQLGLGVILPLTALIIGSGVLGLEIEDGTITHLLTKPLPRQEIVLAKLAVAWAVCTWAAAVPIAVAGLLVGSAGLAAGLLLGAAVGALAYSAVFVALSLMSRRPVAVGLVYIILWENLLTGFVDGTRVLSIREYAAAIAEWIGGTGWLPAHLAPVTAIVLAAVIAVGGTMAATARLRSFSLAGETS